MTAVPPNCLVIPRPQPAAAHRLVIFPHAGGSANFYRPWSAPLEHDTEVQLVQYPGRETRMSEPLVSDLGTLVDEVTAALRATDNGRITTVFFGHSMGAVIAYETALRLAREGGAHLTDLFVSGRRAPGSGGPPQPQSDGVPRRRTDAEIMASLRRHGGTPMALLEEPGMRALLLRVLRNDYLLVDSYRPVPRQASLDARITALWGHADAAVDEEAVRRWAGFTRGGFSAHALDGGHFYLLPQRERVVELLRERLRPVSRPGR